MKGLISSQPLFKNNRTSFLLEVAQIQSGTSKRNCCGRILVRINGSKELHYADTVMLRGSVYRPFGGVNPDEKKYRDYLYRQGIFALMHVEAPGLTVVLPECHGPLIQGFALSLNNRLQELICRYMRPVPASIMNAMVLGEKRDIPALVRSSMVKSGTVHILVVSGFNTGLVAFIVVLLLKFIRLPRPLRFFSALLLLLVYCLMTGASTPVVRATVMTSIFMSARLLKREASIYNSCAVALFFILWIDPEQLFDIGCQLSFVSVISIVYLYTRIKSFLRIDGLKIRCARWLLEGCLVSLSAWLGTCGLIACYFKVFSPVTVLANIFIVPLATLITLSGFSLIFAGYACPAAAGILARACELLIACLLNLNFFLISLPGAYFYLA